MPNAPQHVSRSRDTDTSKPSGAVAGSGTLRVVFVSNWEEGEVRTAAQLNPRDGVVEHIQVAEDCDGYEHLIDEYLESVDGCVRVEVSFCPEATAYRVSADGLAALLESKSSCEVD